MRGFRVSSVLQVAAGVAALLVIPAQARADVTLVEKDGWTFFTRGLAAAHYQFIKGDGDPSLHNAPNGGGMGVPAAGGQIHDEQTAVDRRDGSLTMSNIRSGFIGTQIGFGLNRKINDSVKVESFFAINAEGINSNRGQNLRKDVDYREAYAQVVTPAGTLRFGRMFGIFGEGSAEVMAMAYKYGVGHPCAVNTSTISCGSSGAGPIYAGFDAAIRYISPRIAGLEFALSVVDPSVSPFAKMSPTPRIDAELNFDQTFGGLVNVRAIAQGMYETIHKSSEANATDPAGKLETNTIWGAMGTGILSVGTFAKVGGGMWLGSGVGERIPLEASDPANPIFTDSALTLRKFRGYYGNVQGSVANHFLTVGGGILYVQPTNIDVQIGAAPSDVLDHQREFHVTYQYKYDAIVFNAEFMHWTTVWHFGEKQDLNFMGVGVNYVW